MVFVLNMFLSVLASTVMWNACAGGYGPSLHWLWFACRNERFDVKAFGQRRQPCFPDETLQLVLVVCRVAAVVAFIVAE